MIGAFKFFLNRAELFNSIHGKVYLTNGSNVIDLSYHTTFAICSDCLLPLLLWTSARNSLVFYDTPQLWVKKLQYVVTGLLLCAFVFLACQCIASAIFQRYHRKLKFYPRESAAKKRPLSRYRDCLWYSYMTDCLILPDKDGVGFDAAVRPKWEYRFILLCDIILYILVGVKSFDHRIATWKWLVILSSGVLQRFTIFVFPRKWRYYSVQQKNTGDENTGDGSPCSSETPIKI